MTRYMEDPIPVGPFLWWCDKRERLIRRDLDAYPAIKSDERGHRGGRPIHPIRERLVLELGWNDRIDSGVRRLHRLAHDNPQGLVSRAIVEDALWHADTHIYSVYPDLAAVDERGSCGIESMSRDEKTQAAFWLREQGMTWQAVGEALGYRPKSAPVSAQRLLIPRKMQEKDRRQNAARNPDVKREWRRKRREVLAA